MFFLKYWKSLKISVNFDFTKILFSYQFIKKNFIESQEISQDLAIPLSFKSTLM